MPTIPKLSNNYQRKAPQFNQSAEYYNKYWREIRDNYLQHHPLCENCLQHDIITPAEHVHHINPFLNGRTKAERIKLLTDPTNLMSLCARCHRFIHKELNEKNTKRID